MSASQRRAIGAGAILALLAASASNGAAAAPDTDCEARLTVELTPDVPDASDAGFLSSLLNNHPDYRLNLLREIDPSLIELDLAGPGPDYLCQNVIDAMRKDGRVLSIHVDSVEAQATFTVTPPQAEERPRAVQVSSGGIGALYWAVRHPGEAWRVVLPIQVGEESADAVPKETGARPMKEAAPMDAAATRQGPGGGADGAAAMPSSPSALREGRSDSARYAAVSASPSTDRPGP
jgi:hypothetical protein